MRESYMPKSLMRFVYFETTKWDFNMSRQYFDIYDGYIENIFAVKYHQQANFFMQF